MRSRSPGFISLLLLSWQNKLIADFAIFGLTSAGPHLKTFGSGQQIAVPTVGGGPVGEGVGVGLSKNVTVGPLCDAVYGHGVAVFVPTERVTDGCNGSSPQAHHSIGNLVPPGPGSAP